VDWAVANGSSGGMIWELVELETPKAVPFIRDGNFSTATRKGISQIGDWRDWLQSNLDYAQRPKSAHGLGLLEIETAAAVVIVGRREKYAEAPGRQTFDRRRKREKLEARLEILSYDSFIESLKFRFSR